LTKDPLPKHAIFLGPIGGGAYWAGRATAAHFSVLVGKAYSLPAYFFVVENLFFHNPATGRPMKCIL